VNAEVTTLWRCTNTFNIIIIIIIIIMALRTPSGACQKIRKRTSTDKYFSTTSLRDESWQFAVFTSSARRFMNIDILLGSLATFYEMLDI